MHCLFRSAPSPILSLFSLSFSLSSHFAFFFFLHPIPLPLFDFFFPLFPFFSLPIYFLLFCCVVGGFHPLTLTLTFALPSLPRSFSLFPAITRTPNCLLPSLSSPSAFL
ncbi:uncharacterized protein BO87DRAFT_102754 [Aspergillus neoniger CBS 115656]|uniref:Uncharacterized protein n=1 Tax=Aspergillus neoniger (strain CBS 115656) TaxID=1448310 RepID=A0A318YIY6_ASPNB|nr:hypothetical protein BO87DRAFT_102754 [Aspergillus neoniger CBS 115656]PYH32543.1 hypothetical protein BO87DRAFT_102754 [Aspergillus neoniger CBS 115656]